MNLQKIAAAGALCLLMAGCATSLTQHAQAYNAWENADFAAVARGEISWSEHYRRAYDKARAFPDSMPGKADLMRESYDMTVQAMALEDGRLTPQLFELKQREVEVQRLERRQAVAAQSATSNAAAAAAFGAGLQNIANQNANFYQQRALATQAPAPYVNMNPAPINCLTQPSGNGVMTTCR